MGGTLKIAAYSMNMFVSTKKENDVFKIFLFFQLWRKGDPGHEKVAFVSQ